MECLEICVQNVGGFADGRPWLLEGTLKEYGVGWDEDWVRFKDIWKREFGRWWMILGDWVFVDDWGR